MPKSTLSVLLALLTSIGTSDCFADMPEMCEVPGGGQPHGPQYTFLMSKYEITNAQFVIFLNETKTAFERGEDSTIRIDDSGNIFLAKPELKETEPQPFYVRVFSITCTYYVGHPYQCGIGFQGGRYFVVKGREKHPVVAVSWFGAIKFCNWLTEKAGLGKKERCYSEGSSCDEWHPAHLTYRQWVKRFDSARRRTWVEKFRGYRLPMDGDKKRASPYNEYYKAAAWNGKKNTRYAFGRDCIGPADANYAGSGDPYENSTRFVVRTTPIGFYDGESHDGFQTRVNENHYGIYDLSGNVWELVDDFHTGRSFWGRMFHMRMPEYRAVRGGAWRGEPVLWPSLAGCLRCSRRYMFVGSDETCDSVGFRVVRTPENPFARGP